MRIVRQLLLALLLAACTGGEGVRESTLVVFNAGSLARPLRALLDSFAVREGVTIEQESAGSLETARKLTELGKIPDIIALADEEVFPQILMPQWTPWYVNFARNRMVLAYTDRSRRAAEITPDNWWRIMLQPGIEVGRSNPDLDPNGYRTLLVMQLAERHYREAGLAGRLLAAAPARNVRPKEADLVALLEAGEVDYIWSYESMADAIGLRYVRLPPEIDLSESGLAGAYGVASVRVRGRTPGDTIELRGAPIVYAMAIPANPPHPALAERFAVYMLSDVGRRILIANKLDVLNPASAKGGGVPASLSLPPATPSPDRSP
jgi:molybdate/tungstate transport system substrate-binding protein